jgi:Predicted periplasmic or secreted lipoprotein
MKGFSSLVLIAVMGGAMVACSSTSSKEGSMEHAGATAGRTVDDSVITTKVKSALIADPVTKAHEISVETYDGTVQLSGFVDNSEQRSRAVEIAKEVPGVKTVKNSLQLRSQS